MQRILSIAGLSALLSVTYAQSPSTCSGTFTPITAKEFVANLHPGWNLGNTLDAIPDEGSWNNAPVEEATLDLIKESGFNSVRLPGIICLVYLIKKNLLTISPSSNMDAPFHRKLF